LGAAPDVARWKFDSPGGISALWLSILAGPAAWAVDLLLSYSLVQWTCGGGPPVVLHLISVVSLVVIAAGAFAGWQSLQAVPGGAPSDGSQPDQRAYFMALLGLLMCALFAVVVVAEAIPRWILDACHQ